MWYLDLRSTEGGSQMNDGVATQLIDILPVLQMGVSIIQRLSVRHTNN